MDRDGSGVVPLSSQQRDVADDAFTIYHGISFCGGVLAMLVSGTLYSYGAFAHALESQLSISAVESGWVVKVGNIGLCLAVTAGAAADRFGLRTCAFVGALLGGAGFLLMCARVKGYISGGVVAMSAFYFIAGQGCQFTYMAGLMNYKNIPSKFHGVSLGILDMSFGLSSVIFSQIYAQSFGRKANPVEQDLSGFLFFLGACMLFVNVMNIIVLHVPSHSRKAPMIEEAAVANHGRSTLVKASKSATRFSMDFWLVFVFFVLNQGATVWFIGAVSDMATAFGSGGRAATLTTIITATGAICRISAGVLSDLLHRWISRVVLLLGISLLLPIGFALLAVKAGAALTVSSVLIGAGFGSAWCLIPLLVSDTFGTQNFSTIWGIVIMGSAIGPFILQPIDSTVQSAHSIDGHCLRPECYKTTYTVCVVMSVIASALLLLLARRAHARRGHHRSACDEVNYSDPQSP